MKMFIATSLVTNLTAVGVTHFTGWVGGVMVAAGFAILTAAIAYVGKAWTGRAYERATLG